MHHCDAFTALFLEYLYYEGTNTCQTNRMQYFELHTNASFKVTGYVVIYIYTTVQQKIILHFRYTNSSVLYGRTATKCNKYKTTTYQDKKRLYCT